MKIRTTVRFRVRQLAGCTAKTLKPAVEKRRRRLFMKWIIFNEDKWEGEIFNSCIIMKNLAIVHRELPLSADFMIEELMNNSRALRNIYADILSAYRSGKGEDSFDLLYKKVPVKAAKNFGAILARTDKINPVEIVTYMTAFEETLSGRRMTKGIKRAERRSAITTIAATASVFAVLLNFTVVVVFMDAVNMLSQTF